ncbi:MAG: 1,4-alpha-glucan branching protein GlgB [Christensenellales bacterium]|jgi:1,4-alpha-glucan branching enzyme
MGGMPKDFMGELDYYLFFEGTHAQAYRFMGAHPLPEGFWRFTVWAPNAVSAGVVGNFNGWDPSKNPLEKIHENGLWTGVAGPLGAGEYYQFALETRAGTWILKSDPYARNSALRPNTASRLAEKTSFAWSDGAWLEKRASLPHRTRPMSIYEVHLGSWRRGENDRLLNYREIAGLLVPYVRDMGYTHVELLPVMEHPLDDSWGYQITGFYSVNSRHGSPDDLRYLIDRLHQSDIGVILDWAPAHFCKDDHGLRLFDGAACYEYALPVRGEHPQWGTSVFDYGRGEVMTFLTSCANYWIDEFHVDGLRFDAVSSMLYHDYGRQGGQWLPNRYGGRENIEAVALLRQINDAIHMAHPGVITIAEESTSWPLVTKPPAVGGLGFDYKWNMGWMNDTLRYMADDPEFHPYHHHSLTFSMVYAFSENFILPLSHDEVVHGKKSLLDKMPGEYDMKFAGLRLLYGYQFTHPGKKLMFMGGEIAPFIEWRFHEPLEWHLLDYDSHRGISSYVKALNRLYREHPALWQRDDGWEGFMWMNADDNERSVLSYLRMADEEELLIVCNFAPLAWMDYAVPLPQAGMLTEIFSSDDAAYGGKGYLQSDPIAVLAAPLMRQEASAALNLPPLSVTVYTYRRRAGSALTADGSQSRKAENTIEYKERGKDV